MSADGVTMTRHLETATVFVLGLSILLSLCLSVMGFFILGIGEACCSNKDVEGWAYLFFAALLTVSVVVVIIYAVWGPPKPLLVWSWAVTIVAALEVMNWHTSGPATNATNNFFVVFFSTWTIPEVWLPALVAALCQLEASKGPRRVKSIIDVQGV